jgi:hypothetical protein
VVSSLQKFSKPFHENFNCTFIISTVLQAQDVNKDAISKEVVRVLDSINKVKAAEEKAKPKKKVWYDKISIRGYAQVRYNGLSSNDKVSCDQCDKSWERLQPKTQNLTTDFSKKGRIIFSGRYILMCILHSAGFASSHGN